MEEEQIKTHISNLNRNLGKVTDRINEVNNSILNINDNILDARSRYDKITNDVNSLGDRIEDITNLMYQTRDVLNEMIDKIHYTENTVAINLKDYPMVTIDKPGLMVPEDKKKLNELESVNPDWEEQDEKSPNYIKNKPKSMPADGGNADTIGKMKYDEYYIFNSNKPGVSVSAKENGYYDILNCDLGEVFDKLSALGGTFGKFVSIANDKGAPYIMYTKRNKDSTEYDYYGMNIDGHGAEVYPLIKKDDDISNNTMIFNNCKIRNLNFINADTKEYNIIFQGNCEVYDCVFKNFNITLSGESNKFINNSVEYTSDFKCKHVGTLYLMHRDINNKVRTTNNIITGNCMPETVVFISNKPTRSIFTNNIAETINVESGLNNMVVGNIASVIKLSGGFDTVIKCNRANKYYVSDQNITKHNDVDFKKGAIKWPEK